jgi:hypothetical protein
LFSKVLMRWEGYREDRERRARGNRSLCVPEPGEGVVYHESRPRKGQRRRLSMRSLTLSPRPLVVGGSLHLRHALVEDATLLVRDREVVRREGIPQRFDELQSLGRREVHGFGEEFGPHDGSLPQRIGSKTIFSSLTTAILQVLCIEPRNELLARCPRVGGRLEGDELARGGKYALEGSSVCRIVLILRGQGCVLCSLATR